MDADFRALHRGPDLLRLPNAWDAGSARLVESLGAKAIATTSAGVAWANGYPDGNALPVPLLVAAVRTMVRGLRVPLSVDVEGGYAPDPAAAAENVAGVIDAGAVGINIEDAASPPDLLCRKIGAIKETAARLGVDLFVNARTDVYLFGLVPPPERLAETLTRARQYAEAGADGIFVPAVVDADEIRTIAASAPIPLNVLAWSGLPAASELASLGVRRLSAGSGVTQVLWGHAAQLVGAFLADEPLPPPAMPYPEINALLRG